MINPRTGHSVSHTTVEKFFEDELTRGAAKATLRGSFDHINDRKAAQTLTAFASASAIVLAHTEIEDKSNEILLKYGLWKGSVPKQEIHVRSHSVVLIFIQTCALEYGCHISSSCGVASWKVVGASRRVKNGAMNYGNRSRQTEERCGYSPSSPSPILFAAA